MEFAEGESVEPGLSRHGWQKTAHTCFENEERVWPTFSNTDRAMSRSQRGPSLQQPFVSVFSNDFPSSTHSRTRVLLRRRLRLPLFSRFYRCGRQFDPFSHHRAKGLEREFWGDVVSLWIGQHHKCAVYEAGGRVSSNVLVRDTDLAVFIQWKWWRTIHCVELIAVFRLTRRAADHNGVALSAHGAGKRPTYPEHRGFGSRPIGRFGTRWPSAF